MDKMKLGLQFFTLREYAKTPEAFSEAMKKVAQIGYRYVQISGVGEVITAEVIKKACDETGLSVILTHTPYERIVNDTERVIAEHDLYGCNVIGLGAPPEAVRNGNSAEEFVRMANELAPAVEKIKAAGKVFSYHNHYWEFAKKDGRYFLEYFLGNCDPEAVKLTADVYWLHYSGLDESAFLEQYKDRIACTHFKDMGIHEGKQSILEIMEGNLPYPKILEACKRAGLTYHFVELDDTRIDPFEAIKISYDNLMSTGYFE